MNYYFFTYNEIQYFFTYNDNDELILFTRNNNEYVKLSDDEKEEVIKYLNRKNGYDYDSEKLSQLISSNDRIKHCN